MSAPRVCGDDPYRDGSRLEVQRVLPAYAGMIRTLILWLGIPERAPRVCGDDPVGQLGIAHAGVCSPRMRG